MARRNKKVNQSDLDFFAESEELERNSGKAYSKTIGGQVSNFPEVKIVAKNDSQKELIRSIKNNEITICYGSAGSGKTYVTLGMALNFLKKTTNEHNKIYLIKSVRTLKDEDIGFLPGDMMSKIEPAMQSFFLNIQKLIPSKTMKAMITDEILIPFPVAFMRGVTLDDCIIIVDEAQNLSVDNIKTIMTRIGSNCKLIILGDLNQIDLIDKSISSLKTIKNIFKDCENIGVVEMSKADDNVRNPLIKVIEQKFEEYENELDLNKYTSFNLNKRL